MHEKEKSEQQAVNMKIVRKSHLYKDSTNLFTCYQKS